MFYCGIDIAKRNHKASVIDAEGKPLLDSLTITNTQEGCKKLFALFTRLSIDKDSVIISLKARGKHHLTAVGAVARKLCNIIFVILLDNTPYEATPPKKNQENIMRG